MDGRPFESVEAVLRTAPRAGDTLRDLRYPSVLNLAEAQAPVVDEKTALIRVMAASAAESPRVSVTNFKGSAALRLKDRPGKRGFERRASLVSFYGGALMFC